MTPDDLRARVEVAYAALDLPGWPDPHPDMAGPQQDEYSRYTDAPRFRIAHERGRVWAQVLAELGATVEPVAPEGTRTGGVRITSPRPGTLPLLLLEHDVPLAEEQSVLPFLTIAVERPDVLVDQHPSCGCDACDDGSEGLLLAIDESVLALVSGPYVALRHPGWSADWHAGGGSAGGKPGSPDLRTAHDWCRRLAAGEPVELPGRTTAYVASSGWLG